MNENYIQHSTHKPITVYFSTGRENKLYTCTTQPPVMESDDIPAPTPFAYLRVKRKQVTVFVAADLEGSATGESLHKDSARLLGVPVERLRLVRRDRDGFLALNKSQKLSEQHVHCNAVIVAVLQDDDGKWEHPSIELHRA